MATWPEAVLLPLTEASTRRHPELTFAQFCRVVGEARTALVARSEAQHAVADAEGAGSSAHATPQPAATDLAAQAQGFLGPLLSLQGPVKSTMSDESFVNPLRHLAAGEATDKRAGGDGSGPLATAKMLRSGGGGASSLLENCGCDVDGSLAKVQ